MSLPIFIKNETVLDAEDMSASTIESDLIDVGELGGFAVHSEFTGSPVGTLTVSATNDENLTPCPIDTYSVTEAGARLLNVETPRFKWIQITYTKTSGTGSLTCKVSGKQI
jgi:hypothetical protein